MNDIQASNMPLKKNDTAKCEVDSSGPGAFHRAAMRMSQERGWGGWVPVGDPLSVL